MLEGPFLIPVYAKGGVLATYALVNGEDYAELSRYSWRLKQGTGRTSYAERTTSVNRRSVTIPMHRHIMGLTKGDGNEVDHVNLNGLDNRRVNMRVVTRAENAHNYPSLGGTSKYRGVTWDKNRSKWVARVKHNGKNHYLGGFDSEIEAAKAAAQFRKSIFTHSVEPLLDAM